MLISLIFPSYNEQENLPELYNRLVSISQELSAYNLEFIFVDDASSDQTPQLLRDLRIKDLRVKIIRFTKNFGGHKAITAGLKFCQGDCAVAMAADLQDPPEILKDLLGLWKQGNKIVWAVRQQRQGESFSTKLFSRLYYWLINHLTTLKVPATGSDVFLVDRNVIDAFNRCTEKHTSVYLLIAWLGFKSAEFFYIKESRGRGRSKWTLRKKIKLVIDSLIPFSDFPIKLPGYIGLLLILSGAIVCFFNFEWSGKYLSTLILLTSGLQLILLSVFGEYLWRGYDEARGRPDYIIDEKYF